MRVWLSQHVQALRQALRKLAAERASNLLGALAIGIALCLPAGGYTLLVNLQSLAQRFSLEPQMSVFLDQAAKPAEREALERKLKAAGGVSALRFVSREEALKDLRRTEGLAEAIAALKQNPLPDAFVMRVDPLAPEALDALATELGKQPGVSHVQVDSAWARRLAAMMSIGRLALGLLALLLATGLVAVTFNTIRLQILTQRDEIEVSKLLGATDAFIRRPFYYLGALQGLAGGIAALALLAGSLAALNRGVRDLASTYGSSFEIAFLPPGDAIAIALFAALLGWLGAFLSVSRYLLEIEPR